MKLVIDTKTERHSTVVDEVKRVEVWVTDDKVYTFSINQFGDLTLNKQTFDEESSTIIIKPSVSNEINIV